MVAIYLPTLDETNLSKPFNNTPNVFPPKNIEFDFSNIFGPLLVEPSVGPTTTCPSQILKLEKLTLDDREDNFLEKSTIEVNENSNKNIGLDDFEILRVVGKGGFGKVYQVRKIGTSEIYAMKVMRKDNIVKMNLSEEMRAERDIMAKIDHPFIMQLRYSFQTKYRLYLVLDFVNGGDLFFQLDRQGLFREDLARVYAAEIVSAVCHLHENGIMHRDLKPSNILLDAEGHAMLTDFGLANQFVDKTRTYTVCGTIEYMAPEIILGKGYDKAVDWWSMGILLYEMLTGKLPLGVCGNRPKFEQRILKEKIKLPPFLTSEAHSLLKGLLQKDPIKRLGSGSRGGDDIKRHKWFKSIKWKKLDAREIKPNFIPKVEGTNCIANFKKCWTKMPLVESPASSPKCWGNNPFKGFDYVKPADSFLKTNSAL